MQIAAIKKHYQMVKSTMMAQEKRVVILPYEILSTANKSKDDKHFRDTTLTKGLTSKTGE